MKHRARRLVIAVLVSLTALAGVAAQTQRQSSPQARQKTFDVVWKTVNDKYFDRGFSGVDWAAVRQRYAPRVTNVTSDVELFDLIGRMLGEIPISHLRLLELETLDKALARSVVTTGLALRDIENEVVITRVVQGSPGAHAGLRTGFAIRRIDGAVVADARTAETMLAAENRVHRVAVLDEGGMVREFAVEHQLPPSDKLESVPLITGTRYALVESKWIRDGIGYVHFTNFIAPLKKRLLTAFATMSSASGIILDLRGNSGGETEVGMALAGMLLDKETQLAITRTRKGDDDYYKAKAQKHAYRGPVAILIDQESASESEQVTAGLQEAGRVVVIGKTSRGVAMDATFQELPIETVALLFPVGMPRTPKGTVIEGRGVIPDIEVNLTREELLDGRDAQLEAAIAYLQHRQP